MTQVFVSIGSNIDREIHIQQSLQELEQAFGPLVVSSIYESEAEGFEGESFYNLVVKFDTDLAIEEVLKTLKEIETRHGRGVGSHKFAPRTLDLDLILYGDKVLRNAKTGRMIVPRDDILRYAFVLEPLAEIAPDLLHPVEKKTFQALWKAFDPAKIRQKKVSLPSSS